MDDTLQNQNQQLPDAGFINASVVIRNNTVFRNDNVYYEDKNVSLADFLSNLHQFSGAKYARFYKMDALSKLGWLAAEILLDGGFREQAYAAENVGIILSNANASLDTDIKYYETVAEIPSPALFVYTLPNIVIGEISIRHRFKGENGFFIFEQFDAGFIEQYVSGLLNNNILQACVCGWVDVLGEAYEAALFLVEKSGRQGAKPFNAEIMNQIYQ